MWDKKELPEGTKVRFSTLSDWSKRYTHGVIEPKPDSVDGDRTYVPVRVVGYTELWYAKYSEYGPVHGGFNPSDVVAISDDRFEQLERDRLGDAYEGPNHEPETIEI